MNTLKTFGEVTVTFDHQILNQTDPVDVWVPICRNALRNTFFFFFKGCQEFLLTLHSASITK